MFEREKAQLREKYKLLRASLKSPERDEAIAARALEMFGERSGGFFVYLSVRTEADTAALIRALLSRGKGVCVPRVVGDKLLSAPFTKVLVAGAYGIPQPAAGEELTCATAFVPLLAADEEGNRLGYGGGFYDRYFAAHPEVLRVGLAYEGQLCPRLPHTEGDMPLDALVTERCVRRFERNT